MKFRILTIALLTATLLGSCNKESDTTNGTAVQFTTAITRASGTTWGSNDEIGIYMVATSPTNSADNKQHKSADGSSFTPVAGDQLYYPVNGENVNFIAYYPFTNSITGMIYNVNLATQTSQPAIDLLWSNNATAKNKTTLGAVALTFDHKLSKVIINTTAGDGLSAAQLQGMTVTIKGMNTKAAFDLSTGVLGAYSAIADITSKTTAAGEKYEAIVLPATFTVGALQITFKIGNDEFTWKNPTIADGTFEAGKQYTYEMTITRTGVDFTCTIKDWDTLPRSGSAE